ncbi:MAG: hypothetical protein JWQ09_2418 [Segetibacter sp.]|nr:hypothetical protein [Segetibacter sp.]
MPVTIWTSQLHNVFLNPTYRFELKERQFEDGIIQTHFEDWEALSFLAGITNVSKARLIWNKHNDNENLTDDEIKFAHTLANELREKHGDEILNFLLACPPKPFQVDNVKELFSDLDLAKDKIESPAIRFLASKDDKFLKIMYKTYGVDKPEYVLIKDTRAGEYFTPERHKFSIAFWVEKKDNKVVKRDTEIIVLRNVTTGHTLAHITRSGQFIPQKNAYITKPVISLFFRICKDTKTFIINYGLDSGNCSYCDRELTHPTSIKRNYGKKCGQDRSLPW